MAEMEQENDIVERLRDFAENYPITFEIALKEIAEAAGEIERLRAEVKRLSAPISILTFGGGGGVGGPTGDDPSVLGQQRGSKVLTQADLDACSTTWDRKIEPR